MRSASRPARAPRPASNLLRVLAAVSTLAACASAAHALEPPPSVTNVSPAAIPGRGGVRITIEGSNFVRAHGACVVGVGQQGARTVTPDTVTPTLIVFTCPSKLSQGHVPIVVVAPDAQRSVTWFVDATPPTITSIAPSGGARSGGTLLTIHGHDFVSADTKVTFDGQVARPVTLDDSTIVVSTPANGSSATTQQVAVIARNFQTAPVPMDALGPRIASCLPTSVAAQGGTPLTIYGDNFSAASSSIAIGGADCPVTFASATELHTIAPPQNVKASAVEVTSAGARSNPVSLGVDTTPVVTGLWPPAGRASGGTTITIVGQNFGAAPLVTIGGAPVAATQATPSRITCTTPPGTGSATVSVTNGDGLGGITKFQYLDPPTITSISPPSIPSDGSTILTITGTNFGPNDDRVLRSAVVNGTTVPVRWTAPDVLEARAPASAGATAVTVVVIDDTSAQPRTVPVSGPAGLTPPSITNLTPATASMAGGALITINGSNFGASPQAWVGSTPVATTPGGSNRCTFTAPAAGVGTLSRGVCVTAGGLSSASAALATSSPNVVSVSPPSAALSGGVRLTITGSNFGDVDRMRVRFGGGAAETPVASASAFQLTCVAPPSASPGALALDVVSVDGLGSAPSSVSYAGPVITSISPPTQAPVGGQPLTITGSNFGASAGSVTLGGQSAIVTSWSNFEVAAIVGGTQDPTPAECRVTTSGGVKSNTLLVDGAPPALSSVTPAQGQASGNTLITLTGSNFGPDAYVAMDGVVLPSLERSTNGMVVLTPQSPPGTHHMQVVDRAQVTVPQTFESLAPPVIDHISPISGPATGGTVITIYGSNFGTAQGLRIIMSTGQGPATQVNAVSSTMCTATTDPSATSGPTDLMLMVDTTRTTAARAFYYGDYTGVTPPDAPLAFALRAGPNPFAGPLSMRIALPGAAAWRLTLFDAAGAVVRRFDGHAGAGEFAVAWDGRRTSGARAAPGVYLAKLEAGGRTAVRRVVKME